MEKPLLPTIISPEDLELANSEISKVSTGIELFFAGQEGLLHEVLQKIGFNSLAEFLQAIVLHVMETVPFDSLTTLEEIEGLDLKRTAYSFISKMGIDTSVEIPEEEREAISQVLSKLLRILIHEIALPELIASDPCAATSVKNLVIRQATAVAKIEGIRKEEVLDMLGFDEISIVAPNTYHLQEKERLQKPNQISEDGNKKRIKTYKTEELRKAVYYKTRLTNTNLSKLARKLCSIDTGLLKGETLFVNLLTSEGKDVDPVRIDSSKVTLLCHLLYRMKNPIDKNAVPLLSLSYGKGFWKIAEENFIDESGALLNCDLAKLRLRMKQNEREYVEVINHVEDLLKLFY